MLLSTLRPSLPVELWQYVIRLATLSYDIFDVGLVLPRLSIEEKEAYATVKQDSNSTKMAVVSVSKAWRAVTMPFLFESLVLRFSYNKFDLPLGELPLTFRSATSPLRYARRLQISFTSAVSKHLLDAYSPLLAVCALSCQDRCFQLHRALRRCLPLSWQHVAHPSVA